MKSWIYTIIITLFSVSGIAAQTDTTDLEINSLNQLFENSENTLSYKDFEQQDIKIEVPTIIIEGISSTIKIKLKDADHKKIAAYENYLYLTGSNDSVYSVQIKNGEGAIDHVFKKGVPLKLSVDNFSFEQTANPVPLWMSIIPPLVAILMALLLKEAISSIFMGVFIGAAIMGMYAHGSIGFFKGFFAVLDTYILEPLREWGNIAVVLFTITIGMIVSVITKNGGMQGVVNALSKFATSAKRAQLTTWVLGIAIFIDDYANTLVVGNSVRPITDKMRISREKLSYLVDSTAAPITSIAFVTTWIGAELGYIQKGMDAISSMGGEINEGVYSIFISSLQYSFYPIFTLIFMLFLILKGKDFGPMYNAEMRARKTGQLRGDKVSNSSDSHADQPQITPKALNHLKWYNAIIPLLIVIIGAIIGLFYTGSNSLYDQLTQAGVPVTGNGFFAVWNNLHLLPENTPDSFFQKLGTLIGSSDSYYALMWASLLGLAVALTMTLSQKLMNITEAIDTTLDGAKSMLPAISLLAMAWGLAKVTQEMHTADFITQMMGDNFSPWLLPGLTFLLSAIVAFSTGSSWGTMAVIFPLMLPASWKVCMDAGYEPQEALMIFYNVVSTVLAGAVLGDHCSPISDTTILSSLASSCNHIDHVKTQLPYALTVGGVSLFLGTIPGALGLPAWIIFPIGIATLYFIVHFFGKKVPEYNGN